MAKTMEDVMKIPAGPKRMAALKAFKEREAAGKTDKRTMKDIAPDVPEQKKPKQTKQAKKPASKKEKERFGTIKAGAARRRAAHREIQRELNPSRQKKKDIYGPGSQQ